MTEHGMKVMAVFERLFGQRKLQAIEKLANERGTSVGLVKRIDENRELLELLQRQAPGLLTANPWIEGWISSNDEFFVQLDEVIKAEHPMRRPNFPRAWPGKAR